MLGGLGSKLLGDKHANPVKVALTLQVPFRAWRGGVFGIIYALIFILIPSVEEIFGPDSVNSKEAPPGQADGYHHGGTVKMQGCSHLLPVLTTA